MSLGKPGRAADSGREDAHPEAPPHPSEAPAPRALTLADTWRSLPVAARAYAVALLLQAALSGGYVVYALCKQVDEPYIQQLALTLTSAAAAAALVAGALRRGSGCHLLLAGAVGGLNLFHLGTSMAALPDAFRGPAAAPVLGACAALVAAAAALARRAYLGLGWRAYSRVATLSTNAYRAADFEARLGAARRRDRFGALAAADAALLALLVVAAAVAAANPGGGGPLPLLAVAAGVGGAAMAGWLAACVAGVARESARLCLAAELSHPVCYVAGAAVAGSVLHGRARVEQAGGVAHVLVQTVLFLAAHTAVWWDARLLSRGFAPEAGGRAGGARRGGAAAAVARKSAGFALPAELAPLVRGAWLVKASGPCAEAAAAAPGTPDGGASPGRTPAGGSPMSTAQGSPTKASLLGAFGRGRGRGRGSSAAGDESPGRAPPAAAAAPSRLASLARLFSGGSGGAAGGAAATVRHRGRLRYFQLSHDGGTLRWDWDKYVLLMHVDALDLDPAGLAVTLRLTAEADLRLGFPDAASYGEWAAGLGLLLAMLGSPAGVEGGGGGAPWWPRGSPTRASPARRAVRALTGSPSKRACATALGAEDLAAVARHARERIGAAYGGGGPREPSFKDADAKLGGIAEGGAPSPAGLGGAGVPRRPAVISLQVDAAPRRAAALSPHVLAAVEGRAAWSPARGPPQHQQQQPYVFRLGEDGGWRPPGSPLRPRASLDASPRGPPPGQQASAAWLSLQAAAAASAAERLRLAAAQHAREGRAPGTPPRGALAHAPSLPGGESVVSGGSGDGSPLGRRLSGLSDCCSSPERRAAGLPPRGRGPFGGALAGRQGSLRPSSGSATPQGSGAFPHYAAFGRAGAGGLARGGSAPDDAAAAAEAGGLARAESDTFSTWGLPTPTTARAGLQRLDSAAWVLGAAAVAAAATHGAAGGGPLWRGGSLGEGAAGAAAAAAAAALARAANGGAAAPAPPMRVAVETVDYRALTFGRVLGEGAGGPVYAAWYAETPVAVKRLPRAGGAAELEAHLHVGWHDNVVGLRGVAHAEGRSLLVMELCPRGTLGLLAHAASHRLDPAKLLPIARAVARGMLHLHTRCPPVLHRDLKPGNIFVGHGGVMKIGDFGQARLLAPPPAGGAAAAGGWQGGDGGGADGGAPPPPRGLERTLTPGVIGTAAYAAPELLAPATPRAGATAAADVDTLLKADVYSFGVTLWEVMERRRPHAGLDGVQVQAQWLLDPDSMRLPPVRVPEGLPPAAAAAAAALAALVAECTAVDPAARPSFRQVLAALRAADPAAPPAAAPGLVNPF